MNMNNGLEIILENMINQSIYNRENRWIKLPEDQQEALDKMLKAIHDFQENREKIKTEYQAQALDAVILKAAIEMGCSFGGNR